MRADVAPPVEIRRCRFIAREAPEAGPPPNRFVGENRDEGELLGNPEVVEDRGRVEEAAVLGNEAFPFLEALWGVPDARFLHFNNERHFRNIRSKCAHRFLITSVFKDNGRTTPCSFYNYPVSKIRIGTVHHRLT